jgi:hypothetical protein
MNTLNRLHYKIELDVINKIIHLLDMANYNENAITLTNGIDEWMEANPMHEGYKVFIYHTDGYISHYKDKKFIPISQFNPKLYPPFALKMKFIRENEEKVMWN